jgi:hypothetical protein
VWAGEGSVMGMPPLKTGSPAHCYADEPVGFRLNTGNNVQQD